MEKFQKKTKKKENNKLDNNKWMIVKKEKMSTKIKNYFKNIFSKILNQGKKNKNKSKGIWPKKQQEPVNINHNNEIKEKTKRTEHIQQKQVFEQPAKTKKEITIEVAPNKRKPREIVIEYENKNKPKKKEIVVEYEHKNKKVQNVKPKPTEANVNSKNQVKKEIKVDQQPVKQNKIQLETKPIKVEVKQKNTIKKQTKEQRKEEPQLALKPVKPKKEKKPININIFQLFKDKERKKRKEILNRIRENKVDDYETISTKAKLSKGSIAVDDVDANELDPLIDLYRDSNTKLRNRIKESQQ